MSECAAASVLVECAHLAPGIYRNVDTGAVVEVRRPEAPRKSVGVSMPGVRFGRAVRNAPQAFISLLDPLDQAGQMLISTMLRRYDDV